MGRNTTPRGQGHSQAAAAPRSASHSGRAQATATAVEVAKGGPMQGCTLSPSLYSWYLRRKPQAACPWPCSKSVHGRMAPSRDGPSREPVLGIREHAEARSFAPGANGRTRDPGHSLPWNTGRLLLCRTARRHLHLHRGERVPAASGCRSSWESAVMSELAAHLDRSNGTLPDGTGEHRAHRHI